MSRTLVFLLVIVMLAHGCRAVSYTNTTGAMRARVAYGTHLAFDRTAFLTDKREAKVIDGKTALGMLDAGGYDGRWDQTSETCDMRSMLTARGAIAVLLPEWIPASDRRDGRRSDVLFVPYPQEANFVTGLPDRSGSFFDLGLVSGADDFCYCDRGETGPDESCICQRFLSTCPCADWERYCSVCAEADLSSLEAVLALCREMPGCTGERFLDQTSVSALAPGTWMPPRASPAGQ